MAKHPPNWTVIERQYFIDVILPRSQKPIFGSDEHDPSGYTWDQLAEIMQSGIDRIHVDEPPYTSPRKYNSSSLSQHWRKKCGKLAKETGQLDEFGPKSPTAGSNTASPARSYRDYTAPPRSSKKRRYHATFEDDGDYDYADEEYVDDGGDGGEYIPMRRDRPNQANKATNITSHSGGNGNYIQRRFSGGHDEKTNENSSPYRPNYPKSSREIGPYNSSRLESKSGHHRSSNVMEEPARSSPHFSKQARATGHAFHDGGREDFRPGSNRFCDTRDTASLFMSEYPEPTSPAEIRSNEIGSKNSRNRLGQSSISNRNLGGSNPRYLEQLSTQENRLYSSGREASRHEYGQENYLNARSNASSPTHSEWVRVRGGGANVGVSDRDDPLDTMNTSSNALRARFTRGARSAEVYQVQKASQATQTIKTRLDERQQPIRSSRGYTSNQTTSEVAHRNHPQPPSFGLRSSSSSSRYGHRQFMEYAGESIGISKEAILQPTGQSEDDYPFLKRRPTCAPDQALKEQIDVHKLGTMRKRSQTFAPSEPDYNPSKNGRFSKNN